MPSFPLSFFEAPCRAFSRDHQPSPPFPRRCLARTIEDVVFFDIFRVAPTLVPLNSNSRKVHGLIEKRISGPNNFVLYVFCGGDRQAV